MERDRNKRLTLPDQPRLVKDLKLPVDVLEAAHRSYLDGMTIAELANTLWKEHGYSSAKSCQKAITTYFERKREAA